MKLTRTKPNKVITYHLSQSLSLVTLTATLTDLCERENASQYEARHRPQGHAKTYVETLEAYTTYMMSICPGSVNGDTVRPWRASTTTT